MSNYIYVNIYTHTYTYDDVWREKLRLQTSQIVSPFLRGKPHMNRAFVKRDLYKGYFTGRKHMYIWHHIVKSPTLLGLLCKRDLHKR